MTFMLRRFLAILFVSSQVFAQLPGVRADDYFLFENVGDPQISPDGKQVAYVITRVDREKNRRVSTIYARSVQGDAARVLTNEAMSSSSPRWSPDGKSLAFLSARDGGRAQLWILPLNGGEARRVTSLENGVSACQWAPDSTRFVCISRTGPKPGKSDVRHYQHIRYKFNDTGWFDQLRAHLFVIDAASGQAKQITDGANWNDSDPQWSPDGQQIAFVANRTGKEFDGDTNSDVWVVAATGGEPRKVSDHPHRDYSPRWSPDGKTIAFLAQEEEDGETQVFLVEAAGGKSRKAARNLDQTISDLNWAEQGKALYFNSGVRGTYHLYRLDVASGAVAALTNGEAAVRQYDYHDATKALVYTRNDFQTLDDLYLETPEVPARVFHRTNPAFRRERWFASVERVPYRAADGWEIEGFLVKPINFDPSKKYPLVLSVHGGPAGMYGVDWFHEFQVYAGKGWAVFFANPRGSTGYGHKFERGVKLEWGGKAYTDIMSGVDTVLAKNPWIDRDRLGMTGGSYGGFMVNWISTQTNRFKASVTLRCISNFISDEGTRDGAYGHDRDFGGDLFQNFDLYWHYSPLKHVKKVKTPTLVLHSDNDYRTPLEQGEQWFRALQHLGVESEFVIFPRENHNLTRTGEPKHIVESLLWQCYWFERHLDGNQKAKRPNE
jgi:dipeptidyl aminopeptidase/acylaminoacyl peptidase